MVSLLFIALVAGASAQSALPAPPNLGPLPMPTAVIQIPPGGDENCLANYIVKQCLLTESDKLGACGIRDFQCICYASQDIATCYNNCPNDTRAPLATQNMNAACSIASLYYPSTAAQQTATTPPSKSPTHTTHPTSKAATATDFSAASTSASKTSGAGRAGGKAGTLNVAGVALALFVVGLRVW
ncbi:hypothetical protein E4U21_004953 [Claviceps maximensis]|nr:hypothetical protein E4U21_004953 [Claviceps maximensis]